MGGEGQRLRRRTGHGGMRELNWEVKRRIKMSKEGGGRRGTGPQCPRRDAHDGVIPCLGCYGLAIVNGDSRSPQASPRPQSGAGGAHATTLHETEAGADGCSQPEGRDMELLRRLEEALSEWGSGNLPQHADDVQDMMMEARLPKGSACHRRGASACFVDPLGPVPARINREDQLRPPDEFQCSSRFLALPCLPFRCVEILVQ